MVSQFSQLFLIFEIFHIMILKLFLYSNIKISRIIFKKKQIQVLIKYLQRLIYLFNK